MSAAAIAPAAVGRPRCGDPELQRVFDYLNLAGMQPSWHGDHVVANVPGFTLLPGLQVRHDRFPEIVRSMPQAVRLVEACK